MSSEWIECSNEEYHKRPEIGRSQLETFITKGPVAYLKSLTEKREPTDAMVMGTIIHAMVLENKSLDDVAIVESSGLKTRASKAWDAFAAGAFGLGLFPLLEKQVEPIVKAVASITNDPGFQLQMTGMKREQSLVWRDRTGLDLRCRFDAVDGTTVLDLKTTSSESVDEGALASVIAKYGYDRQDAFYSKGYYEEFGFLPSFVFAFVQVVEPYETALIRLSPSFISIAMAEVDDGLSDLAARMATGNWKRKTYGKVIEVEPPRWRAYRNEYTA